MTKTATLPIQQHITSLKKRSTDESNLVGVKKVDVVATSHLNEQRYESRFPKQRRIDSMFKNKVDSSRPRADVFVHNPQKLNSTSRRLAVSLNILLFLHFITVK